MTEYVASFLADHSSPHFPALFPLDVDVGGGHRGDLGGRNVPKESAECEVEDGAGERVRAPRMPISMQAAMERMVMQWTGITE